MQLPSPFPLPLSLLFSLLALLTLLPPGTNAQFGNIFEQMFGGSSGGGGGAQFQQSQPQRQNVGSDSSWYRGNWENAHCDKYLCPATLSCVDKPSHCPCAWPNQEDKIEMSESLALCASKGGWKEGEMARKVDLARKGLM
ncbi:Long chronological lifespan protein 2 [Thelotrema lepadinum]|nr:Long chronological lifespan protein 2 [Thelotrema lepadinum]